MFKRKLSGFYQLTGFTGAPNNQQNESPCDEYISNGAGGDLQWFLSFFSYAREMASVVPPNYVCPRVHDVVLHLDSFFIGWLVLKPSHRVGFVLSSFSLTVAVFYFLFLASRKKQKYIPGVLCSERGSERCDTPRNERWKFLIY